MVLERRTEFKFKPAGPVHHDATRNPLVAKSSSMNGRLRDDCSLRLRMSLDSPRDACQACVEGPAGCLLHASRLGRTVDNFSPPGSALGDCAGSSTPSAQAIAYHATGALTAMIPTVIFVVGLLDAKCVFASQRSTTTFARTSRASSLLCHLALAQQ